MSNMLDCYASSIIGRCKGFILNPDIDHVELEHEHRCKMCGAPVKNASTPEMKSFTNIAELSCKSSPFVCEYCANMTNGGNIKFVQGWNKGCVFKNIFGAIYTGGEHPERIIVECKDALEVMLSPPVHGKPFVFIRKVPGSTKNTRPTPYKYSNSLARHTAWMAKVNHSNQKYYMQVAFNSLLVDCAQLKEVTEILKTMDDPAWILSGSFWKLKQLERGEEDVQLFEKLGQYPMDLVRATAYALKAKTV